MCYNYPLKALELIPPNSSKLILSFEKCYENPLLADKDPFPH